MIRPFIQAEMTAEGNTNPFCRAQKFLLPFRARRPARACEKPQRPLTGNGRRDFFYQLEGNAKDF
jgi:hypothetical protein